MIPMADMALKKALWKNLAFFPFSLVRPEGEGGIFLRYARYGSCALLLLALGTAAGAAQKGELRPVKNPIPADAFMLRDLDGKLVSLSDFEGKVVLLNFWAMWCPPCRKEMPAMERLYQAYGAKGFAVVGVSVDQDAPAEVKAFVERLKITFPILHDRDSIVSRLYSNPGVPSSYLIDRQGRIIYRVLGEYDWFSPGVRSAVEELLPDARKNN